jgi:hypothetical protein
MSATVYRLPLRPGAEPWLTKRQLAAHLGYSTRWIEQQVKAGMPCQRWGGRLRFQVSAVEAWLKERYE